jgi:hypothetical protein
MSPEAPDTPAEPTGNVCTCCGAHLQRHHNYCYRCGTHVSHRPGSDDDRRAHRPDGDRPWFVILGVVLGVLVLVAVIMLGVLIGLLINDDDGGSRVIVCPRPTKHERVRCSSTNQNGIEIQISVNTTVNPPSFPYPPFPYPPPAVPGPPRIAG